MPPEPRISLLCLPHSGAGGTIFRGWRWLESAGVEVMPLTLPGRDHRRGEQPLRTAPDLIVDFMTRTGVPPEGPYVLYGHSLGGLAAFTVTDALAAAGLPLPALVAVGACPPPDAPLPVLDRPDCPDEQLLEHMGLIGGVPDGAVPGDVWHRAVLPVLRIDLRLATALRKAAHRPLPVPLLAVAGTDDPLAGPGVMAGWRRWTTSRFTGRSVPGGHFFVRDSHLPVLLAEACAAVRRHAATSPTSGGHPTMTTGSGAGVAR